MQTTLPTTNAEVFAFVKAHLLAQGARATILGPDHLDPICRYRDSTGRKCAIGCLITDKHYHPGLEGLSAGYPSVQEAVTKSLGFAPNPRLLGILQGIHDSDEPSDWPECLQTAPPEAL